MSITKIVSGGQTGVDRAALDAAMELGVPHGGWVPKGRRAEDGVIAERYNLREMPTERYQDRTEQNVMDSDGTLLISRGELTEGSELTRRLAVQHKRPTLHVDLETMTALEAAKTISIWILRNKIEILNVAGPRASKDSQIYRIAKRILKSVLFLSIFHLDLPDPSRSAPERPRTVEEAAGKLDARLSMRDKTTIARVPEEQLPLLYFWFREDLEKSFGLCGENRALRESCVAKAPKALIGEGDCCAIVVRELWKKLRETRGYER